MDTPAKLASKISSNSVFALTYPVQPTKLANVCIPPNLEKMLKQTRIDHCNVDDYTIKLLVRCENSNI